MYQVMPRSAVGELDHPCNLRSRGVQQAEPPGNQNGMVISQARVWFTFDVFQEQPFVVDTLIEASIVKRIADRKTWEDLFVDCSFVSGHVLAAKLSDHRRTIRPDAVEFIDSGFGAFLEKRDRRGPFRIRAKPSPRKSGVIRQGIGNQLFGSDLLNRGRSEERRVGKECRSR